MVKTNMNDPHMLIIETRVILKAEVVISNGQTLCTNGLQMKRITCVVGLLNGL